MVSNFFVCVFRKPSQRGDAGQCGGFVDFNHAAGRVGGDCFAAAKGVGVACHHGDGFAHISLRERVGRGVCTHVRTASFPLVADTRDRAIQIGHRARRQRVTLLQRRGTACAAGGVGDGDAARIIHVNHAAGRVGGGCFAAAKGVGVACHHGDGFAHISLRERVGRGVCTHVRTASFPLVADTRDRAIQIGHRARRQRVALLQVRGAACAAAGVGDGDAAGFIHIRHIQSDIHWVRPIGAVGGLNSVSKTVCTRFEIVTSCTRCCTCSGDADLAIAGNAEETVGTGRCAAGAPSSGKTVTPDDTHVVRGGHGAKHCASGLVFGVCQSCGRGHSRLHFIRHADGDGLVGQRQCVIA